MKLDINLNSFYFLIDLNKAFVKISKEDNELALKALDRQIVEDGKVSARTILKRGLPFTEDQIRCFSTSAPPVKKVKYAQPIRVEAPIKRIPPTSR